MARHIGNGIYVCADGIEREWDGGDAPARCYGCEDERADGDDGLCGFCREERSEPPLRTFTLEQRARLDRIARERRADIERLIRDREASDRAAARRLLAG